MNNTYGRDFVRLPAGWQETAKRFKPVEFIRVETHEEIVSALLRGYVIKPSMLEALQNREY